MKLQIKPATKNIYPLEGVLIKSKHLNEWFHEFQALKLNLSNTLIYAIPDTVPNSIWGFFILFNKKIEEEFL